MRIGFFVIILTLLNTHRAAYGADWGCVKDLFKKSDSQSQIHQNFFSEYEKHKNLDYSSSFPEYHDPDRIFIPRLPWKPEQLSEEQLQLIRFYDLENGTLNLRREKPFYLSSENGREPLKAIRIVVAPKWSEQTLIDYLNALEQMPEVELLVNIKKDNTKRINDILSKTKPELKNRVKIIEVDDLQDGHVWAQDTSKPLISPELETLSPLESPAGYEAHVRNLKKSGQIKVKKMLFSFEGGNVIVGDKHVFTGTSSIEGIMRKYKISRSNALGVLEGEWGKPVVEVGTRLNKFENYVYPIDFHIDLSMAVAYSPKKNKEIIFISSIKPVIEKLKNLDTSVILSEVDKKIIQALQNKSFMKKAVLREKQIEVFQKQLNSMGYEVIEVPHVSTDDDFLLNYTNVIFSQDKMTFPINGSAIFDEQMKSLFVSFGFQPMPMKVVEKSIQLQGGIRCLSEAFRQNYVPIR